MHVQYVCYVCMYVSMYVCMYVRRPARRTDPLFLRKIRVTQKKIKYHIIIIKCTVFV